MDRGLSFWLSRRSCCVPSVFLFLWIPHLSGCATGAAKHDLVAREPRLRSSESATCPHAAPPQPAPDRGKVALAQQRIAEVLDDWHDAASTADEGRYFGHFATEAVFMGTDATERWDVAAFRKYAHPHFAKGKAWSFRAVRRAVIVEGAFAWFDEDLATPNLGPARGSGVMRHDGEAWRIAHYNLTITVPNERFKEVKKLLDNDRVSPAAGTEP